MDIPSLGVEQADGADVVADAVNAKRHHLRRGRGSSKQPLGCPVDTDIRCLRRQHNRHQQRVGAGKIQFCLRLWLVGGKPLKTDGHAVKSHLSGCFSPSRSPPCRTHPVFTMSEFKRFGRTHEQRLVCGENSYLPLHSEGTNHGHIQSRVDQY